MSSFPIKVYNELIGQTLRFSWVSSGNTPSQISSALVDKNDLVVNSMTAISSGNGFYYAVHTLPNSAGWYVNEFRAWVDSYQYVDRQMIRARTLETD